MKNRIKGENRTTKTKSPNPCKYKIKKIKRTLKKKQKANYMEH